MYIARYLKAFALTGRQICVRNNPGRCPGLGASALSGRVGLTCETSVATITLRPDVYDKAAIFARKDKLNIEDWVNKILQKIVDDISEKEDIKAPAESKMFSWEELGGMFASDKSDKELRDEYLEEKYGI